MKNSLGMVLAYLLGYVVHGYYIHGGMMRKDQGSRAGNSLVDNVGQMTKAFSISGIAGAISGITFAMLSFTAQASVGLFNTGVDDANNILATGVVDSHYTVVAGTPAPTYAVNDAENFVGYWLAPSTTSKWITPLVSSGYGAYAAAAGAYAYQTTFDLTGIDLSTASISGKATADNSITDILINGVSTGFTWNSYSSFGSFSIGSGFISGLNTLTFNVDNSGGPTGLRVEMNGMFTTAVPEPEVFGLMLSGLGLVGWAARRRKQSC